MVKKNNILSTLITICICVIILSLILPWYGDNKTTETIYNDGREPIKSETGSGVIIASQSFYISAKDIALVFKIAFFLMAIAFVLCMLLFGAILNGAKKK